MPSLQGPHFRRDAEQVAEEILDMRRQIDHQIGLKLARKSAAPSFVEAGEKSGVSGVEIFQKRRVQPH